LSAKDFGPLSGNNEKGLKASSAAPTNSQAIGSSIFKPSVEALSALGDQDHRPATGLT
jgi:hypothetical protein